MLLFSSGIALGLAYGRLSARFWLKGQSAADQKRFGIFYAIVGILALIVAIIQP